MRALVLMRGSAGCGKSTFINKNGLKPFSLCADDIRLMCATPTLQTNGKVAISQINDKVVWKMLFRILETRMQRGEFTVIDATNSKTEEMNRYKELAKMYRYRIYCIDMTDIPIDEVKRRNKNREELKQVPEEVIDKFYSRFETQQVPAGIKILKPNELKEIWYKPMDLSEYKKIHVIGDVHGCYTVLKEYFDNNGGINHEDFYIFTGDYVDRGIENADTIKYLCELSKYKNIVFLEGNHEKWLWMWANDIIAKSKEFEFITKPELNKHNVSKKKVREFYRKLNQCCYFTYKDKDVIVTHGGISNMPENLLMLATEQIIRGVGKYDDADIVDKSFVENTIGNLYQIHGHRNITNSPIKTTERTFNLEGQVEFGGQLRIVQISEEGFTPIELPNRIFKDPKKKQDEENLILDDANMSVYKLVEKMRQNKYIYEKTFGKISSFNFTKQAFKQAAWSNITNKARGLYIDTADYKVVARAYEKFFNINERPETELGNLRYKLQFPVSAYVKENGFLGIVGWNTETNDLLITSKSSPDGEYSGYLRNILYSIYGQNTMNRIKEYIKKHNVSFVFECCDIENDPHIIEYSQNKAVLLDIILNKISFEKMAYNQLVETANDLGLVVKEKAYEIASWEDFFAWYHEVTSENYRYNNEYIEGFVIEDAVGYMIKLKVHYYKFWKHLRSVAYSVLKYGNYKHTGSLLTPLANEFFGWCKSLFATLPSDEKDKIKNICTLRNMFFEWKTKYSNYKEEYKNV